MDAVVSTYPLARVHARAQPQIQIIRQTSKLFATHGCCTVPLPPYLASFGVSCMAVSDSMHVHWTYMEVQSPTRAGRYGYGSDKLSNII